MLPPTDDIPAPCTTVPRGGGAISDENQLQKKHHYLNALCKYQTVCILIFVGPCRFFSRPFLAKDMLFYGEKVIFGPGGGVNFRLKNLSKNVT